MTKIISAPSSFSNSNTLKALLVIGSLSIAENATAANLLVNGGFEADVQVANDFATINIPAGSSAITGWRVVQGSVDLTTAKNYGPGANTLNSSSINDIDLIGDVNAAPGGQSGIAQSFATTIGQE